MAKNKPTAEPIMENEYVKELLAILRENNARLCRVSEKTKARTGREDWG